MLSAGSRRGLQPHRWQGGVAYSKSADPGGRQRRPAGIRRSLSAQRRDVLRRSGRAAADRPLARPRRDGPRGASGRARPLFVRPGRNRGVRAGQAGCQRGLGQAGRSEERWNVVARRAWSETLGFASPASCRAGDGAVFPRAYSRGAGSRRGPRRAVRAVRHACDSARGVAATAAAVCRSLCDARIIRCRRGRRAPPVVLGRASPSAPDRLLPSAAGFRPVAVHQAARSGRSVSHGTPVLWLWSQARRRPVRAVRSVFRRAEAGRSAAGFRRSARATSRPAAGTGLFPLARTVFRRPHDPVCLHGGPSRGDRMVAAGQLSHFSHGRRWHRAGAADGRTVERVRSLLAAQRPDCVHLRTPRRLSALWRFRAALRFPNVHVALDGRRWQRHDVLELSRNPGVAAERRSSRHDRLHALGLCRSRHERRASHLELLSRRPRSAQLSRQLSRETRDPAVDGDGHSSRAGLEQVRGDRRRSPRPRLRLAGADRLPAPGRRRDVPGRADHAGRAAAGVRRRQEDDPAADGVRNRLAAERGRLPVRLRPARGQSRRLLDRPFRQSRTAVPRSGDLLPEPDPVATASLPAGAPGPDGRALV